MSAGTPTIADLGAALQAHSSQLDVGNQDMLAGLAVDLEKLALQLVTQKHMVLSDVSMLLREQCMLLSAKQLDDGQLALVSAMLVTLSEAVAGSPAQASIAVELLCDPRWLRPLASEDAQYLLEQLLLEPVPAAAADPLAGSTAEPVSEIVLTPDVVVILVNELSEMAETAKSWQHVLLQGRSTDPATREHTEKYQWQLERFASAAQAFEMEGLAQCCLQVVNNLGKLESASSERLAEVSPTLTQWPQRAENYFRNITDTAQISEFCQYLQSDAWLLPFTADQAAHISASLSAVVIKAATAVPAELPEYATDEDVTLAAPDDLVPALMDALLAELPIQCERLSNSIQAAIEERNHEALRQAQRVAHTVKGAANTVGIRGLANLTHRMEDLLVAYAERNAIPQAAVADLLVRASDCLYQMSDFLMGKDQPPTDARLILQEILDVYRSIKQTDQLPADTATVATDPLAGQITAAETKEDRAAAETLRISLPMLDQLFRLTGEVTIATTQLRDRLERATQLNRQLQNKIASLQQLAADFEEQFQIRSRRARRSGGLQQVDEHMDPLEMERYNELDTLVNRFIEDTTDAAELQRYADRQQAEAVEVMLRHERMGSEQRDIISRFRLLPVSDIVPRLQRGVRQAARMVNKQIELKITGIETLVDSQMLNQLVDPLMHILRNAIDHGIESAEQRQALNKTAKGQLQLSFQQQADDVLVQISDDGAGLDYEKIKQRAVDEGIFAEADTPNIEELNALILRAGFSTREQATQTAGRGIGLNAVAVQIAEMNGTLRFDSVIGQGSTFTLHMPLSLIATSGSLVRCGESSIAISDRFIDRVVNLQAVPITVFADGSQHANIDGIDHVVLDLSALLQRTGLSIKAGTRAAHTGLVLKDAQNRQVLMVDEVLGSYNFVVKSLGEYLKSYQLPGMLGITILGDGSVTPIFDPQYLVSNTFWEHSQLVAPAAGLVERKPVLVVDDSISVRRTLSQLLVDAGYQVNTAVDGMDAVSSVHEQLPLLVIVDMEMPRMSGLEFTEHLRTLPQAAEIPVIMLTSRATDQHRQLAKAAGVDRYLTKPYQDDALLDVIDKLLTEIDLEAVG